MARPPTRQPFQPTSTAPATIGQGVQNVQRGVQQVAPQAAVPQATNVNVQQTVKTPAALQGLVNSIAQAEMLQSGQTLQQEGAAMMYAPGGGKKDNWRNAFAGSLRAHRGRKKVKEAIALEDQLMAEQAEKQRIANKLAQQQEMEARGQAAEIIAQLQPRWNRDQIIAAAAEVVAGRLAMKDIADFNKVEGEPKPNLKEVKTVGPDGVETSQWVVVPDEGEAKPRVTGMPTPEEPEDPKSPFSPGEQEKARNAYKGTLTSLTVIDDFIKQVEEKGRAFFPGTEERAKADSLKSQLIVSLKDSFELGALQGPDIDLLMGMIPELGDGFKKGTALTTLKELKGHMNDRQGRITGLYPMDILQPPINGDLPQVTDEASYNALPDGAEYVDPNGVVKTKGAR